MRNIKDQLDRLRPMTTWQPPLIFDLINPEDSATVSQLLETNRVRVFTDAMKPAIEELYDIRFPQEKDIPSNKKSEFKSFSRQYAWPAGKFVYYPWIGHMVRTPNKEDLRRLRTSRNRNLITSDEQEILYKGTIFIAGLSVGSNILEALISMGIGGKFIIADMDVIEPSNLNRIHAPYHDVGIHKADAIAMRMSEIDPYLDFEIYRDGLTYENLEEILDSKSDIVIDEMDQLQLKIKLRREAKKRRLPVISAADDGDSALLDIERYDLDSDYPLLHGHIPERILAMLESSEAIPRNKLGLLIGKYFVGSENIPLRMFQSLAEVGKTLPSWPQLGDAAAQSGISIAYATRKVLLGQPLNAGRFVIGPETTLDPSLSDANYKSELAKFQAQLDSFNV